VHAVRREKAVLDALAQAVGVDRVAEVLVAVARLLAQRRGRHAELHGGREVVEYGAPVAVVAAGATVAFVDDDQIEEVRAGTGGTHLRWRWTAPDRCRSTCPGSGYVAAGDLVAGIAKRREHLGHRVIDQDVAVGQEQDLLRRRYSPVRFQRLFHSFQQIWNATQVLPVPVASVASMRFLPSRMASITRLMAICW
jgi:hypothetical protein